MKKIYYDPELDLLFLYIGKCKALKDFYSYLESEIPMITVHSFHKSMIKELIYIGEL